MKKLLLISTIFFSLTIAHSQTNIYQPFADSNAVWNGKHTTNTSETYYLERIIGDTIINSLKYHKLYFHSEQYMNPADTIMTISNSYLYGGIREDSTKKIYYYCMNSNSSTSKDSIYLLYDFSLNVGDTINFPHFQYGGYAYPALILNSVDSVLVNNQYRKQYNFGNGYPTEKWIEGIGSTRALLSTIMPVPTCYCSDELICYKFNDNTYYLNPDFNYCFSYFTVNVTNYDSKESISISPNPFSTRTFLQTDNFFRNATLTLYNSLGGKVKQIKNIYGQSISLHRDNLPSGLYFCTLTQDNKTFSVENILIVDN